MIDTKHRFQGRNSLRFVYQKGDTLRGQYGALRYVRNGRRDTYRVAVVVSRKVHKSAVVRNRIRRRIYEAVRPMLSSATLPYDIVFIVYSDQVAQLPHTELVTRIANLLGRAGIIAHRPMPTGRQHDIVKPKEN